MHSKINSESKPRWKSIDALVQFCPDLPALPAGVLKVMELTNSSDATASDIAQVISTDQALTARVLRLANSALFGMPRSVTSLKEAVVILGLKNVRNLALLAGALPWLSRPLPGYEMPQKALMMHAFGVATGAKMAAKLAKLPDSESAYIAGLLCDIGKFALSSSLEGDIASMIQFGLDAGMTFDEIEVKALGFSHAEVSARMAEKWNLPQDITTCLRWHHDPQSAPEFKKLTACVHIGDFLTNTCGLGLGGDGLMYNFDETAFQILNISADDLDVIINEFVVAYEVQEAMLLEIAA